MRRASAKNIVRHVVGWSHSFIGLYLPPIFYESAPGSNSLLDDIVNRPLLALSMLVGVGAGISALITGLVAIVKRKERALLVFGSTMVGAGLTLFLIAEFLFPH